MTPEPTLTSRAADLFAAAILAATALVILVLILHHPVLGAHRGVGEVAAGVQKLATMDRIVHGGLLVMLGLQVLAFQIFSARLGWRRPAVAMGFIACVAGAIVMTIPTMLDGFVTPDLADACLAAAQSCAAADAGAFRLIAAMIQDFTKLALVTTAAATLSWSLALLATRSWPARASGAIGPVCAGVPIAVLVGSSVHLQPGNLAALIAAQLVWGLTAAGLLASGRLRGD